MKRKPRRGAKLIRPAGGPAEYQHARALVEAAVANRVVGWAKPLALPCTDARFDRFREDVTWALDTCLRTHILGGQYRQSDLHEYLLELSDAYFAVAEKLCKAQALRARLPLPLYHEFRLAPDPLPTQHQLKARAEAIRLHAEEWKNRQPELMPAFNALTEGLVIAYRHATERLGVGYSAREGKLRAFVESVLKVAVEIAKTVTHKSFETPADLRALGEQVNRIARKRSPIQGALPPAKILKVVPLRALAAVNYVHRNSK
jgi:hypothetical protein